MPIRSHDAIPSFIQLEEQHQLLSTRPDSAIVAPSVQQRSQPKRVHQANRVSSSASKNNMDKLSPPIEQTTTMFMRRLNISHNPHHHPHAISKRGGHRSATLRVRGKHGAVKSPHMYSSVHCRHSVDIHSSDPLRKFNYSGPFNQESRLVLLKKYMQSRRIHLRQRLTRQHLQQHDSLDTSDMSLDEADLMEEDDDVRDQQSDLNSGLATDQEQYRRYMWTLEQRLRERIRSAERSRSHFLMERRLSAGERVDHAYRVVQRQRTEQEDRQHRARDKLEQKMMRAMARRNAYLEAAIENDPSRRFRRKSSGTTINSTAPITSINKVTTHLDKASTPEVKRPSSDLEVAAPIAVTKVPNMKIFPTVIRPNSSFVGKSTTGRKNEAHKHGSTKNSLTDMTQVTDEKHLTSMTTRKCILPTLTTMTKISPLSGSLQQKHHNSTADNDVEASAVAGVHRDMKITATSEMQRHSYERLIQRASRDYIKAIGSHQYIFTLGFDELARLLHTSKPLIHATLRLLKYSSQLVQLTQDNGTDHNQTFEKYKNPARVFLSMYMVLAHPSQIRSPTEYQPAASEDQTINPVDDSAFDSLVQASKNLLEALEVWLAANCTQNQSQSQNQNQSPSNQDQAPEDSNALLTNISNHPRRDPATVKAFDDAWASYYNFFQAWKERDAQRLLSTLLDHARHINLLWRTVRNDPSARIEWEPRIEEQRKDLRVKASQLAGPEGAAQLDVVFADYMNGSAHTVTPSLAPPSQAGLDNIVIPAVSVSHENTSDSVHPRTQTTPSTAKKRQRASSVSKQKSAASATTSNVSKDLQTTYSGHSADMDSIIQPDATSATSSGYEAPKPKKPATTSAAAAAAAALETIPTGFEKPTKWTNLQLIHELAMDSGFKVEPNRPLGARTMHESPLLQTADQGGDDPTNAATGLQGLEDRIRAMATKAYFDQIRDDAAKGQLGKWIPSLLTTIREQLLDMVPPNSAIAMQITEGFDIEFVQQQIEKNVYDLTGALNGVVDIMSKLCAPVRDQAIKRIQESLNEISQDPSQLSAPDVTTETSATSIAPNDLVSVLQSILELLELMLLDMANFRLTVARPKLEKQAIPYEQSAFKESVDKGEVSLESTQNWLQDSAKRYLQQQASAPTLPVATEGGASSSANDDIPGPESSSNPGRRRHYDILVHSLLDLVFSSKRFDVGIDRVQFPATLALDRERMTRFQNEVQGLALVAVIMNISTNVSPMLSDESHEELKNTLLKLMEAPNTSLETLAEAVIEAKERELLMNARRSASKSSSPSSSAPGSSLSSTSSIIDSSSFPKLLLSDEQRNCIQNTVARAISFDSTLFRVLSQRLRKVLEDFTLSTPSSGGKSGAMPNEAALSKVGLGHLKKEIETLALQFRFLTKYNAQVYRPWYDPMLAKIISNIKKSGKQ